MRYLSYYVSDIMAKIEAILVDPNVERNFIWYDISGSGVWNETVYNLDTRACYLYWNSTYDSSLIESEGGYRGYQILGFVYLAHELYHVYDWLQDEAVPLDRP